jgi:hypothetical protein
MLATALLERKKSTNLIFETIKNWSTLANKSNRHNFKILKATSITRSSLCNF